ncbi:Cif family virulence factor [Sphingomonas psychrotolerans]|uniref:DUF4440 domain-containing protein n=1 Tax=Sphingomonas psychrotolerans TaxID=1327635 RepID=A0A2K8MMW1_9SPHN|nr:hypothetical protein [Sphingomonas psychrotolerans]ATY33239.1 hypothetical protein CVN68_15765 [Sphingomonas psychrotolerans]
MLALLLLQVAAPQTAVDAERAFNAAAQEKGQWTAFRDYAAADATMFVPQPVKAQGWLKDREDPPKSVEWWPTESYVSCDGKLAVNTGGAHWPSGAVSYFTTVWRREADGSWKWIVDGGDALKVARERPAKPKVKRPSCRRLPSGDDGRIPIGPHLTEDGEGTSPDRSLLWEWHVMPDGHRTFLTHLWDGDGYEIVLLDDIAAPAK